MEDSVPLHGADPRVSVVTAALSSATQCWAEARITKDKGIGLYAARSCDVGEVLLEVPLRACISSADVSTEAAMHFPPSDSLGKLVVVLLKALALDPPHDLASYFQVLFNKADCMRVIGFWEEGSLAAQRAAHCVAWQRARQARADAEAEFAAMVDRGLLCASETSMDQFLWAKLVVQTRAHSGAAFGHSLCPIVDLANHVSVGATCHAQYASASNSMQMIANFALDEGDELSVCYDPDADFLDMFERYGFFDASSVLHTVEVIVPNNALWAAAGNGCRESGTTRDAWRQDLISVASEHGCDAAHEAWWVPDEKVDECPLFWAVRATLISEEELQASTISKVEMLKAQISREREVRAHVTQLLQAHLSRYVCTADQARQELVSGSLSAADEAATQLVYFERRLLERVISDLEKANSSSLQHVCYSGA